MFNFNQHTMKFFICYPHLSKCRNPISSFTYLQGFLTSSGLVNPARVQMIMQELGKAEDSIFKERQRNEISFKARMKAKKRREAMFSREAGPKWQPTGQFAPQALGGRRDVGNKLYLIY